jgi:hypothetical protein
MMTEKEFDVISIVAARKSKLYNKILNSILKELPPQVDERGVRERIQMAIAAMDNRLLISASENANGIKPSTPIEELGLNLEVIKHEIFRLISIQETFTH